MKADFGIGFDFPDAVVRYDAHFLARAEADALLLNLQETVHWIQHRIRLFGREIPCPRLSAWYGDPGSDYAYSGLSLEPSPWLPELRTLRERLESVVGVPFNSVLLNRYRDGRDSMGWHADDEPELGPDPVIASVSLGAVRTMKCRHRSGIRRDLPLEHGSLLVMAGSMQHHWKHSLPKTRRPIGERINLTFRRID